MINTLSELLKEFVEAEKLVLNKYDINHRPTIGAMYEGLTKELVEKSVFSGLNLKVTTQSFIDGCDTEFDIILAEGDGEQVPHTTSYKYRPSQVIAVIQVKKTLNSEEICNSYANMKMVADVYQRNVDCIDASMASDAFKNICRKELSAYSKGQLNQLEEYIYHTLVVENLIPLRIVLGYNGYKTEKGLRKSYRDFLSSNQSMVDNKIYGFSPLIMPNLIISDGFSLVKLTGSPYSAKLGEVIEGWWEIMVSSHYNPMHFFLETLWTKLSYRFRNLPQEIFGEDLEYEPMTSFLRAKIHCSEEGQVVGWDYEYSEFKEEQLLQNSQPQPWRPAIIDMAQYVVLQELGRNNIDIIKDKNLTEFVTSNGYASLEGFISSLQDLGFVTLDGNIIRLLTKQLVCVMCPDGNTYAADNYDGRLSRWVTKNFIAVRPLSTNGNRTIELIQL